MRITVDIPDGLLERVMELGGYPTKRAAAVAALEECIRRRREPQAASEGPKPAEAVSNSPPQRAKGSGPKPPKSVPGPRPARRHRGGR